jgi:O-antigen/teichoic acid export membrane protein
MQLSKTKNTVRNISVGYISKIIQTLMPFLGRTALLYILGSQYIGLSSLFSSILGILSFAELNFGATMVFSMYKPIANDDKETICALLNLYKKIYRIVGTVVLICGLAVMPFLKFLIAGGYPADINLYVLFFIYLFNSVVGYFAFSYKSSLFSAHQRGDILELVKIFTTVLSYGVQIALLFSFKTYYAYVIVTPIMTILYNVIVGLISKKQYPDYFCKGKCSKETVSEIKTKISALAIHKVGSTIQGTIDNLAISSFLGLTLLAIYNNYYYIISAVLGFVSIIFSSMTAGIGNSMIKNSEKTNLKIFRKILYLSNWIIALFTICIFCLSEHFMIVWVQDSSLLLPLIYVFLFSLQFYVTASRRIIGTYKDALGMWKEDQWKPIVESIVNFVGTFVSVSFFGLYGVIISTIVASLFVGAPWEINVFFKQVFSHEKRDYLFSMAMNIVLTVLVCVPTYYLCELLPATGFVFWLLKALICLVAPNIILAPVFLIKGEVRQFIKDTFKKLKFGKKR